MVMNSDQVYNGYNGGHTLMQVHYLVRAGVLMVAAF